jgi:hypothetical protein
MEKISASESIAQVMAKVSGVAKRDRNEQQNFNFRGIDAVVNAVGPALREVGGFIVSSILEKNYEYGSTKTGTVTVQAYLTVMFSWHGTDGGEPIRGSVACEARDTSDKATAKAMSVGYRTFLLQTLMLPTDEKDPDADYIENKAEPKTAAKSDETDSTLVKAIANAKNVDELQGLWDNNPALASGHRSFFTARRIELGGE